MNGNSFRERLGLYFHEDRRNTSFGKSISLACVAFSMMFAAGCSNMSDRDVVTSSFGVKAVHAYSAPAAKQQVKAQPKLGAKQASVRKVSSRYLGRAPYICSPSGFGRTSRCFAR
jgi:hypothetical protein